MQNISVIQITTYLYNFKLGFMFKTARKALIFASEHFGHPESTLRRALNATSEVVGSGRVENGFGPRRGTNNWLRYFAHPFRNFTGAKKCKIWSRFSTAVAFEAQWFQSRATYRKSKTGEGSADDCTKYWQRHFAHPCPNFYWGSNLCEMWLQFPFLASKRSNISKI